ncbi:hypothetical protein GE107_14265 [Cohnella sp. CFH 77786]|uniref:hypothetical protein n=1 Tax=Cohnella sp. CFH 77786 TaxID=2662265 RepID=UPI001C6087C2|nr:hypothetical protein [Cohnella sp. CFH 77786]MBW5447218.1 hypothetical protein [Cohnella sp. CFH 77786]
MVLLVIAYLAIAWGEWIYLKTNTKKTRTKWVVFGVVAFSFLYNVFVLYTKDLMPTQDALLVRLFGPIQQRLSG